MNNPIRKHNRLSNFDYSTDGYYFVTICSKNRKNIFGSVPFLGDNKVIYSKIGYIIEKHILEISKHYENVRIDKYVIMPNHIHMIVIIGCGNEMIKQTPSLSNVVGLFKSGVSKEVKSSVWHRSFHDHIIRTQIEYERIWEYIDSNPNLWYKDCYYL